MLDEKRKKRVRRLKQAILALVSAMILIPVLCCVFLLFRVHILKGQVTVLQEQNRIWEAALEKEKAAHAPVTEEAGGDSIAQAEMESVKGTQKNRPSGMRKVYLTFDDGPSIYTDEILDILQEYGVKATFFVVGNGKTAYEDEYRRIVAEGHTLGMHSYSHKYQEIYASREAYIRDLNALQDYLYEVTGVHSEVCRFPGGSSNQASSVDMQELISYLDEIDVTYYDWNISSGDATNSYVSSARIVENCMAGIGQHQEAVILLHDASDKKTTVKALPELIEKILALEDTVIVPITADTEPVQHVKMNN